jgi:hypothetical protein
MKQLHQTQGHDIALHAVISIWQLNSMVPGKQV